MHKRTASWPPTNGGNTQSHETTSWPSTYGGHSTQSHETISWPSTNGGDAPSHETSVDVMYYMPLYKAATEGDWKSAEDFFRLDPNALVARISNWGNTALCIASLTSQTKFMENLIYYMPAKDLAMQDLEGFTALHNIATNGDTKAAKMLVAKNSNLTQIRSNSKETPLLRAALYGHKDLVRYLCDVTRDESPSPFRGQDGAALLVNMIDADLYDEALHLIGKYPEVAVTKNRYGQTAIRRLAFKSWESVRKNGVTLIWQHFINLISTVARNKIFYNHKTSHSKYLELVEVVCYQVALLNNAKKMEDLIDGIVLLASEHGNVELIKSILKINPMQIWSFNDLQQSMLHIAIIHRQTKVFNYIKSSGFMDQLAALKDWSEEKQTILHLAAKLSPSSKLEAISGAALQVQHELRWYKEVEKIVQPLFRDEKNKKGKSPKELFTKEHTELLAKGESWLKEMASSSMVVATLIATIAFAAAITVPGGNESDKGLPIFLHSTSYMVFAVSDALAFAFSLTSILMFLSIQTARYAEKDFHKSLPQMLIIGLATLYFAIATMAIAFVATYVIMLGHRYVWVCILLAFFTCFPVALYGILQFRLFYDMCHSTYGSTM